MVLSEAAGSVIGSGIGTFGNVLSGIGNYVFGRKNMLRQYQYQKALQEHAAKLNYNYMLRQANELPQAQRTGLENAGYNPLLALGGMNSSTAFAGTGSAGLSSPQGFDNFGDSIANAYKVFHQQEKLNNKTLDQMDSNINNNNANSALAEQQAKTEESKRNLMADESMLKQSQYMLNQVEMMLRNKDLEWYDRRALAETKSMLMNAISNQIGAQAQMSNAATAEKMYHMENKVNELENFQRELRNNYDKRHLIQSGFRQGSERLLPGIGAAVGIGASLFGVGKALKYMLPKPSVGFRTK